LRRGCPTKEKKRRTHQTNHRKKERTRGKEKRGALLKGEKTFAVHEREKGALGAEEGNLQGWFWKGKNPSGAFDGVKRDGGGRLSRKGSPRSPIKKGGRGKEISDR